MSTKQCIECNTAVVSSGKVVMVHSRSDGRVLTSSYSAWSIADNLPWVASTTVCVYVCVLGGGGWPM